jgi:cystathionine beta-lyase/cystathionine gamma-synthase
MTHASMPRAAREQGGIRDELVRISPGCEDFEDLRDDLDQALNAIKCTLPASDLADKKMTAGQH